MAELEKIEIPKESFKQVLKDNTKILFSGIFGSGKTTFIKDFFEDNEEYEDIHIFPVNYSTASNQDVFELIKYDILIQLLGKLSEKEFKKIDIPYELTLWAYLANFQDLGKKLDFFASFLSFAGNYGRGGLRVFEKLTILTTGYQDFHENHQFDDLNKIKAFLQEKSLEKGHLYEEDLFTELIRSLILKIESKGKTTVLIIDDLDRLDPDHVFRLLNVFSAHVDFLGKEGDNKFDISKVIFVADYSNLRGLYLHRYGFISDFEGYMDKFYSSIFWYNSSVLIKEIIYKYLNEIQTTEKSVFSLDSRVGSQINYVLNQLLDYNLINIRELERYNKVFEVHVSGYKSSHKTQNSILSHYSINAISILKFFVDFFNNHDQLLEKIDKAKKLEIHKGFDRYDSSSKDKMSEMVLLLNHSNFTVSEIKKLISGNKIELKYKQYIFECRCINRNYVFAVENEKILLNGLEIKAEEVSFFEIFEDSLKVYLDLIRN